MQADEEPTAYLEPCSMAPSEADKVRAMIASHFPAIGIFINSDRETYSPSQAEQIPTGEVLVTIRIPHEGINMPIFYREFSQVLNSEKRGMIQRERE